MLGDRLGPVRVVVESPRDDGLLALLLGSTDLRLALDLERRELGRRRRRTGRPGQRPRRRRAVSVSPLPRAAVLRGRSSSELAATIEPLLEAGLEVFAYFQHEDAPTAPAYAARLLELVRPHER